MTILLKRFIAICLLWCLLIDTARAVAVTHSDTLFRLDPSPFGESSFFSGQALASVGRHYPSHALNDPETAEEDLVEGRESASTRGIILSSEIPRRNFLQLGVLLASVAAVISPMEAASGLLDQRSEGSLQAQPPAVANIDAAATYRKAQRSIDYLEKIKLLRTIPVTVDNQQVLQDLYRLELIVGQTREALATYESLMAAVGWIPGMIMPNQNDLAVLSALYLWNGDYDRAIQLCRDQWKLTRAAAGKYVETEGMALLMLKEILINKGDYEAYGQLPDPYPETMKFKLELNTQGITPIQQSPVIIGDIAAMKRRNIPVRLFVHMEGLYGLGAIIDWAGSRGELQRAAANQDKAYFEILIRKISAVLEYVSGGEISLGVPEIRFDRPRSAIPGRPINSATELKYSPDIRPRLGDGITMMLGQTFSGQRNSAYVGQGLLLLWPFQEDMLFGKVGRSRMRADVLARIAGHEILHGFGMLDRVPAFHEASLFSELVAAGHQLPPDETNTTHLDVSGLVVKASNTILCIANVLRLGFKPRPVKRIKDILKEIPDAPKKKRDGAIWSIPQAGGLLGWIGAKAIFSGDHFQFKRIRNSAA